MRQWGDLRECCNICNDKWRSNYYGRCYCRWGGYLEYHLHLTLPNSVCITLHSKYLETTVIATLHQPCMVLPLSQKKMGCHPMSRSTSRNSITDPCTLSDLFLLQITLTIWPPTAAKHMADFCPKFLPPQTIACTNQMAWNTASAHYAAFYATGIRYYLEEDLTIVGRNL